MADRLDVLLGILLDKAAQKDVERGITSIEQALGKLDDTRLDVLSIVIDGAAKHAQELEERFAQARQEAERLSTSAEKLGRISAAGFAAGVAIVAGAALAAQNYVKFVEDAGIQGDATADRWIAASKRVKNAQLNLGQDAAQALLPVYEQIATLAEKVASFANAHPELVQAGINTGVVVATAGAIGLAVSKGIRLVADFKYLAATVQYDLATRRFEKSVREYLAGELLGGLNKKASQFALNAAGRPYDPSTGRFVSKAAYEASLAAGGAAGGTATGGLAGLITSPTGIVALIAATAAASVKAAGNLKTLEDKLKEIGGPAASPFLAFLDTVTQTVNPLIVPIKNLKTALERDVPILEKKFPIIGELLERLGLSADKASTAAETAEKTRDFQREADLAQATQSFIQYRQQEAQAEEQYMQQRAQIVEQGAAQLAQIEANYSQQRAQLAQQFASQSAQALSNFNYQQAQAAEQFNRQQEQAVEQFNRSESRALEEYNNTRREAREDYQEEEQRSREDHLREMQRMEEDSQDRQRDLIAARDALGLVKERRDLARRLQQAEEDFGVERQRRRQEIRQRLVDLEEQFQAERARRREDFAYQQAQAKEQFAYQQAQAAEQFARQQEQARQQYEERLKQLDEQHRQELLKARQQTAERLREIALQYRQEQITRRNAFYDILRDLDANLLGEQNIRKQYYARMQQDLIDFLNSTASSAGSNLPGYQHGGYTPEGAIRAHRGEWVATRETTNALERMVGSRLTQEGVRSLAGGRRTFMYQDQRRFDSRLSVADRRAIQEDTKQILEEMLT